MKDVLVLGATSGIATEMLRQLTGTDANLVLCGRNQKKLDDLKNDLLIRGSKNVQTLAYDLLDSASGPKVVSWLNSSGLHVDTIILAHGVLGSQNELEQNPASVFEFTDINFSSHVYWGLVLAEWLANNGGGSLVILTSVAGDRGKQSNCVYSATLAGRTVFADGLRNRYLPKNVMVSTIKLGPTESPMTVNFKKGPLWIDSKQAAKGILDAIRTKKMKTYVPGIWYFIMLIIRSIPEAIFVKMRL